MKTLVTTLAAAAMLAVLAPAASAQNVSEVDVTARAPTQVRIEWAGRPKAAVKREVHVAAGTVCRNAVVNRDLEVGDLRWCSRKSEAKALKRYAALLQHAGYASSTPAIVLSAR
ncbi:hypothetical protein [Phenylobacterium sp.]|jgi:hypothetical protein|uniref:hypothetical protein n=1 Tax=Phenylobacterium sp. TaxID=1871053 RepID=UPI0039407DA1